MNTRVTVQSLDDLVASVLRKYSRKGYTYVRDERGAPIAYSISYGDLEIGGTKIAPGGGNVKGPWLRFANLADQREQPDLFLSSEKVPI